MTRWNTKQLHIMGPIIPVNLIEFNSVNLIGAEGWKGQNPSKTFRFEGSFVENLQKPST